MCVTKKVCRDGALNEMRKDEVHCRMNYMMDVVVIFTNKKKRKKRRPEEPTASLLKHFFVPSTFFSSPQFLFLQFFRRKKIRFFPDLGKNIQYFFFLFYYQIFGGPWRILVG